MLIELKTETNVCRVTVNVVTCEERHMHKYVGREI